MSGMGGMGWNMLKHVETCWNHQSGIAGWTVASLTQGDVRWTPWHIRWSHPSMVGWQDLEKSWGAKWHASGWAAGYSIGQWLQISASQSLLRTNPVTYSGPEVKIWSFPQILVRCGVVKPSHFQAPVVPNKLIIVDPYPNRSNEPCNIDEDLKLILPQLAAALRWDCHTSEWPMERRVPSTGSTWPWRRPLLEFLVEYAEITEQRDFICDLYWSLVCVLLGVAGLNYIELLHA